MTVNHSDRESIVKEAINPVIAFHILISKKMFRYIESNIIKKRVFMPNLIGSILIVNVVKIVIILTFKKLLFSIFSLIIARHNNISPITSGIALNITIYHGMFIIHITPSQVLVSAPFSAFLFLIST
jgi:hypothetical protein